MTKNQKVSVIIPVYNGEKTLKLCLDSVLNQTYKNYEVIVVDNNSTDRTKGIIKDFQKKDKKVRYLFEAKRGRGAARNKGEINSKGEVILMTDSDCIVPKNWVKEMTKPIIIGRQVAVQGMIKPIIINYWTKRIQKDREKLIDNLIKNGKAGLLDTANFSIKRSVLKEIEYTNPEIFCGNDFELMIQLKIKGYEIYFKKFAVLHYHPNTAIKVFKKILKRGEWYQRIKKMHKSERYLFENTSSEFRLGYFIRVFLELLTLHENFKYDFFYGMGWRMGLVYGWMKR